MASRKLYNIITNGVHNVNTTITLPLVNSHCHWSIHSVVGQFTTLWYHQPYWQSEEIISYAKGLQYKLLIFQVFLQECRWALLLYLEQLLVHHFDQTLPLRYHHWSLDWQPDQYLWGEDIIINTWINDRDKDQQSDESLWGKDDCDQQMDQWYK